MQISKTDWFVLIIETFENIGESLITVIRESFLDTNVIKLNILEELLYYRDLVYLSAVTANTFFRFRDLVQPICLPSPGDDFPTSSTCTISGWGATARNQICTIQ